MPQPVLVFDLDGTLIETMGDLAAALNFALEDAGHKAIDPERIRSMVGHGARKLIERGLEANGVNADDATIDPLFDRFIEYYSANIAVHSQPFPGILEAIARFREEGWACAVCTNKLEGLSRPLLDALDMTKYFEAIVGGDTFDKPKPDAMPVLGAIERAGGDPARAVMVGDSRTDIDAARAAGIPVVAVTFGYTPVHVSELGPDKVISHFDELYDAVGSIGEMAAVDA
ncbi:phosphoglycolate phosphatase [Stappia sp. GBMRC 2046]|uniref:Phosphoglycolate phosphatase n=1 Tax=Stappia sediminis TaxID=2692190 RepID=A0A7X3S9Q2_9HYPH|nr:phosphoglycolate phosphatase [Stappia sediminis]MXN67123.1 phosphoglycolate phosphatase [Stappia sediminis]